MRVVVFRSSARCTMPIHRRVLASGAARASDQSVAAAAVALELELDVAASGACACSHWTSWDMDEADVDAADGPADEVPCPAPLAPADRWSHDMLTPCMASTADVATTGTRQKSSRPSTGTLPAYAAPGPVSLDSAITSAAPAREASSQTSPLVTVFGGFSNSPQAMTVAFSRRRPELGAVLMRAGLLRRAAKALLSAPVTRAWDEPMDALLLVALPFPGFLPPLALVADAGAEAWTTLWACAWRSSAVLVAASGPASMYGCRDASVYRSPASR